MTLREAKDAERRAFRLLQSCPASERTFRAQQLRTARQALRKAEAMAALEAPRLTEEEARVQALDERVRRWVA